MNTELTYEDLIRFILDNYPQEVKEALTEYINNHGLYELADRLGYFDEE